MSKSDISLFGLAKELEQVMESLTEAESAHIEEEYIRHSTAAVPSCFTCDRYNADEDNCDTSDCPAYPIIPMF